MVLAIPEGRFPGFRVVRDGGGSSAGVGCLEFVETVAGICFAGVSLGIRFLEQVIKTQAGELQLLRISERRCRQLLVTIWSRGDEHQKFADPNRIRRAIPKTASEPCGIITPPVIGYVY